MEELLARRDQPTGQVGIREPPGDVPREREGHWAAGAHARDAESVDERAGVAVDRRRVSQRLRHRLIVPAGPDGPALRSPARAEAGQRCELGAAAVGPGLGQGRRQRVRREAARGELAVVGDSDLAGDAVAVPVEATAIDPDGLAATLLRFKAFVPPFFAIALQPSITSSAGLVTSALDSRSSSRSLGSWTTQVNMSLARRPDL